LDFTLNFRLILVTQQEPSRGRNSSNGWAKKTAVFGLISLLTVSGTLLLGSPKTAEASILSIVSSFFSSQVSANNGSEGATSQKMALLEAPLNANVNAGSSSEASPIIHSTLLSSEMFYDSSSGTAEEPRNDTAIKTYVVKSGDTMGGIAKSHGISVNTIVWANNLKRDSKLTIGQKLVILPISGVRHKVVAGDTLDTITKKYRGDMDEIIAYNDLEGDKIKIGQIIVVPAGELPASQSPQPIKTKIATAASKVANVALGVTEARADIGGYFMRPISSGVRTQGIHGYNGVDLADSCGTPVYAAAAGLIEIGRGDGRWNGGYGNYIVVNHDSGAQTLYAHLEEVTIEPGSEVEKGQLIGTIGATGKVHGATGCHLHFEIRNGGRNPF